MRPFCWMSAVALAPSASPWPRRPSVSSASRSCRRLSRMPSSTPRSTVRQQPCAFVARRAVSSSFRCLIAAPPLIASTLYTHTHTHIAITNCSYICNGVEKCMDQVLESLDPNEDAVAILDPPRRGVCTCGALVFARSPPSFFVLLTCLPSTHTHTHTRPRSQPLHPSGLLLRTWNTRPQPKTLFAPCALRPT